jgi:hypothetical protein
MNNAVIFVSCIILAASAQVEIFMERQALADRRTGPDQ